MAGRGLVETLGHSLPPSLPSAPATDRRPSAGADARALWGGWAFLLRPRPMFNALVKISYSPHSDRWVADRRPLITLLRPTVRGIGDNRNIPKR